MKFKNRTAAGRLLAGMLKELQLENAVVLALPRGGVPVGFEIARTLNLPMDIFLSKKIGYPGNPEFAIGSVTLEGAILNGTAAAVDPVYLEKQIGKISQQLLERHAAYYGKRQPLSLLGKVIILTDDGVATGNTLFAAIQVIRKRDAPSRIIVAVPVAPTEIAQKLSGVCDDFICPFVTDDFSAISRFYDDFPPVEDEEVIDLLKKVPAKT